MTTVVKQWKNTTKTHEIHTTETYNDIYINIVRYDDIKHQNTYDYCDQNSTWTDIEELVVDGGVVIYPNPTKDILNIATSRIQNVLITMFNISGQTVINQTNEKTIDISHLENGVYFMNVTVGDLVYIRKVIKQ